MSASPASAAAEPDAPGAPAATDELLAELRKEASTMALYVAICLLAVVIWSATAELDVSRLVLAVFVALVGFAVARRAGASVRRSLVYAGAILAIAVAVALVKNTLSGH